MTNCLMTMMHTRNLILKHRLQLITGIIIIIIIIAYTYRFYVSILMILCVRSTSPRTVAISALSPSLLVGFYCENESSWRRLTERLEMLSQASEPIIGVVDKHSADIDESASLLQSLQPNSDPLLMSLVVPVSRSTTAATTATTELSLSREFGLK